MKLELLIGQVSDLTREFGHNVDWSDADLKPKRIRQFNIGLNRWSAETRLYFCDDITLAAVNGTAVYRLDGGHWTANADPAQPVQIQEIWRDAGGGQMVKVEEVQADSPNSVLGLEMRYWTRVGEAVRLISTPAANASLRCTGLLYLPAIQTASDPATFDIECPAKYERDLAMIVAEAVLADVPTDEQGKRYRELANANIQRLNAIRSASGRAPNIAGFVCDRWTGFGY